MDDPAVKSSQSRRSPLGKAGWLALILLLALLAAAIVYAALAWSALESVAMSGAGWLFLVLGALLTIAVGGGLMALVFYSSRHHYDR